MLFGAKSLEHSLRLILLWDSASLSCYLSVRRSLGIKTAEATVILRQCFVFLGLRKVTLVDTSFVLEEADMYIFEPQKYYHAVSKPFHDEARYVVTLRYFYN